MNFITLIKEIFSEILAVILIIGILLIYAFVKIEEGTRVTLENVLLAVVFYFFGSSAGSRRKQNTIDKVVKEASDVNI